MKNTDLAQRAVLVGQGFKKVGGNFISSVRMEKFLNTIEALGNLGRYDINIKAEDVVYSIEDYKVDAKLVGLVKPRMVTMPGVTPLVKDVRKHNFISPEEIFNPAEFMQIQFELANMFKSQPNFTSIVEAIKPVDLGSVSDLVMNGKAHVESLRSIKAMPVELTISSELFEEGFFEYDEAVVMQSLLTNLFLGMASK